MEEGGTQEHHTKGGESKELETSQYKTQNRVGQAGFLRDVMSVKSIPICFVC